MCTSSRAHHLSSIAGWFGNLALAGGYTKCAGSHHYTFPQEHLVQHLLVCIHFLLQGMGLLFSTLFQQFPHCVWHCENNSSHPPKTEKAHKQCQIAYIATPKLFKSKVCESILQSKQQSNSSLPIAANEYTQPTFDKWLFSSGFLWFLLFFLSFWKYINCQKKKTNKKKIFFLKKKKNMKECSPLFSISVQGTSFIWLNARERIIQSPIRLVCIFFQDDSLSLLATDGLWQLTTFAVMPVYDFICVTLHVTAAFFLFCLQKLLSVSVAPEL